jgi:hypothetical protein
MLRGAAVLVANSFSTSLSACPNCALGREARALICQADFGPNLLAVVLPFLVIGAVCAQVEKAGLAPRENEITSEAAPGREDG